MRWRGLRRWGIRRAFLEPKDGTECPCHLFHIGSIDMAKHAEDTAFIDPPHLLEEHDGIVGNPTDTCRNQCMRWQHGTADARRKRRNNGMRTDGVRTIDLDNKGGPDSRLLCPDHRVQVRQDHVPPDHCHHRMSPRAKPSSYVSKLRK